MAFDPKLARDWQAPKQNDEDWAETTVQNQVFGTLPRQAEITKPDHEFGD